jgi:hypothetical protein
MGRERRGFCENHVFELIKRPPASQQKYDNGSVYDETGSTFIPVSAGSYGNLSCPVYPVLRPVGHLHANLLIWWIKVLKYIFMFVLGDIASEIVY